MFGLVDVSHRPSLGTMRVVPDCTAATLLPLIQQHVAPGTPICVARTGVLLHCQMYPLIGPPVNHSIQFTTRAGVHTQNIESYWNRVKRGCHADEIETNFCGESISRLTTINSVVIGLLPKLQSWLIVQ